MNPDLCDSLLRTVATASADPGRFVKREFTPSDYGGDDPEPLYHWQARAIITALGLDDFEAAADRMQEAISTSDQQVARCRPNKGQVRVGLEAALNMPRGSSVGLSHAA